jgi:hypothetical protein
MIIINIAVFWLCAAVSLFFLILFFSGKITGINFHEYGKFRFFSYYYIFFINMFLCIMGIFLFIKYIICEQKKIFSKIYILLIPSIIVSLYFVFLIVMWFLTDTYIGFVFPLALFALGSPLLLFYYLNQKYKLIMSIILCVLFPFNILICYFIVLILVTI